MEALTIQNQRLQSGKSPTQGASMTRLKEMATKLSATEQKLAAAQ